MLETLASRGIKADETMHAMTLTKMVKESDPSNTDSDNTPPENTGSTQPMADQDQPSTETGPIDPAPVVNQAPVYQPPVSQTQRMIPENDVRRLIAEALAAQRAEGAAPVKQKKITEYTAHVWRFDGKWVVDFVDHNTDPYMKEKRHAYNKFNAEQRRTEAWIELVFEDGTTKDVPLTTYVQHRVLVYCPIIKRHIIDKSYVIGEVEKKKEVNDMLVGTGVMVDQEVTMNDEVFEVKTPDGQIFKLPSYVIA